MSKFNTTVLKRDFSALLKQRKELIRDLDQGKKKALKGEPEKLIREDVLPGLVEFERRDFSFGTPDQCWDALNKMALDMSLGLQVRPEVALWFVTAMNKLENRDIRELTKALGLYEHGRKRQFNKFDLSDAMDKFVNKEGMTKAEASRRVSAMYGCNPETAIMWLRRRDEIYAEKK